MISEKNNFIVGSLFQFSPYIIFLTTYVSLYYYTLHTKNIYYSSSVILAELPLFAAFIATIYAFFTFKESLKINKKIEIFLLGAGSLTAMQCYFNIICIAIFNHMLIKTNGVMTVVTISLLYIPTLWIAPILFLIASMLSIFLNSLYISTIIFMPIAHGIAQSLQIDSAFIAATIISGALCGSHLSLYFNKNSVSKPLKITSILQLTDVVIIAAAITTLIILSQYQCPVMHPTVYTYLKKSLTIESYTTIIPYCFLLIANIFKTNLLVHVIIGSCIALITQIMLHKIFFLDAIATMFHGFCQETLVVKILFLHIIIAGLTKIIKYNGGFSYMIENLKMKQHQNSSTAQASVIFITLLINLLVIIDTLCFHIINHPIRKLAHRYHIPQNKVTSLLHITTTTTQVLLPYASIMFMTIHITHHTYSEIIKYMVYPIAVAIFMIISILLPHYSHRKTIQK